MKQYQKDFIDFLVKSGALLFGDFTTKSGRKTPYFINTGRFDDGAKIAGIGGFYADHIISSGLDKVDVIFGPAYKGIPLCVTTSASLAAKGRNIGFAFNRKESKDHGDKGMIVGRSLKDGDRVLLVEDVITAGTTMREVLPLLASLGKIVVAGVVIAVDRRERGTGSLSAVQEAEQAHGIKVYPVVTIHDILEHLGPTLKAGDLGRAKEYLKTYGVD
jgi:orotate phosphoribosyltransferase